MLWVGLVGLLLAIGFAVEHSSALSAFDRRATSWAVAHRSPALDSSMKVVTWLGSWVALVVTAVLLVVLATLRKIPVSLLAAAVVVWAGEAGAVSLSKHVVQRPRPPPDLWLVRAHGWSWPSGHVAVAVVVFATLAMTVTRFVDGPVSRASIWALAVLAVLAVAFSRIELGVHWTTDTLASLVLVSSWVVLASAAATSEFPRIG